MRLSVVMAVRNGEPFVQEAIESVLAQSVSDFEFLIVDDASTDNTAAILSEYRRQDSRVRVWNNERQLGPYPSVNRALMSARSDTIARHDADDISPPECFSIQLEALTAFPDVALVTGTVDVFGATTTKANGLTRPPSWQPRLEWELLFNNAVGAGAHVVFPRVVGGSPVLFPATHRYAEDDGLWCRLSRSGRVECPAEIVHRYRQHDRSISSQQKAEQAECARQIRGEYQSLYLRSAQSPERTGEISRFWTVGGDRPLSEDVQSIHSMLTELRSGFLAYVGQRYGREASATLEADLSEVLDERISDWLRRSIRFLDWKAAADLLDLAKSRGNGVGVLAEAIRATAGAGFAKIERSVRGGR
jgi:hypothetical protein